MHFDKNARGVLRFLRSVEESLPMLFWLLLLFGFDTPYFAMCTLISAALHELGHILALFLLDIRSTAPLGHITGFRILPHRALSYREDALVSLGGPLANLIFSLLFWLLSMPFGEYFSTLALFGVMTMLSNLAPIEGYDGYRLILALSAERFPYAERCLRAVSFFITAVLLFLSLYLIDKLGTGYWIYAIFSLGALSFISKSQKRTFSKE